MTGSAGPAGAKGATGAPGLSNYQIVQQTMPLVNQNQSPASSGQVFCPAGTKVLSGGVEYYGDDAKFSSWPQSNVNAWDVIAFADYTRGTYPVAPVAYAICASVG
jgi:hypothetical protein